MITLSQIVSTGVNDDGSADDGVLAEEGDVFVWDSQRGTSIWSSSAYL